MITNKTSLAGQKIGKLKIISKNKRWSYNCICDCGSRIKYTHSALSTGIYKSCGCLHREQVKSGTISVKHGRSRTPEYNAWLGMRRRCSGKETDIAVKRAYFDRGIRVCDEWNKKDGFEKFFSHVGKRPDPSYSLDRINVNGNYEAGNVRWATREVQACNRRKFGSIQNFSDKELLDELYIRGIITSIAP